MRFAVILSAGALALAACSSDSEPTGSADDYAERVGTGTAASPSATPTSSLDQPPPPPMAALGAARPVPEKFRGVWDFVDGNCMASSDLRLEIGASQLEFHESAGQVNGFEQPDPDTIVLNLSMEGEGENWEERTRLTLTDGGRILESNDVSPYGAGQPLRRKRCPA